MKLVLKYLQSHLKIIILLVIFTVVFVVVFRLYNIPTEPVLYAAVLCSIIGLIALVITFSFFVAKHRILIGLQKSIAVSIDRLPSHNLIIEEDYRELIRILHSENKRLADSFDIQHRDMLQYYTLWAHQIKTPISAMRLLLQAEESQDNSELESELFKIEQYVEMVLGYLRSDSMSTDLSINKYELNDIVKQAVRKYAREFIRRKIRLNYEELQCQILTDEKWLVFALEQLISNALKYTRKGEISIYMEACPSMELCSADIYSSGKDAQKTLIIQDSGIGILAEDLPRVFERGFTGFNGRLDKKSTGIGLYLVKRILKMLGHTISIESTENEGTKVILGLDSPKIAFD